MKAELRKQLQSSKIAKTIDELTAKGYHLHHEASQRGYCSVDLVGEIIDKYNGRFGKGYIVCLGKYNDSNNFRQIAYYVK